MQRGNTKHSPRLTEELDHETRALLQSGQDESRTESSRIQEAPLDDERAAVGPPEALGPAAPGQPSAEEIELRSELARALEPRWFPSRADELLHAARAAGAADHLLAILEALPADRTYDNVEHVWEGAGHTGEHRS